MGAEPWMKWYPADWRAEARLKMVSRAARSLWIDMLGLMHESIEYGKLLIAGHPPTDKQLGAVLGDRPADITKWRTELETMQVYSKDENGVIFSRRMVRDAAKRAEDRANGQRGGNPSVKAAVKGGVNPPVNGDVKAQIPEARVQKPEEETKGAGAPEGDGTEALPGWLPKQAWDDFRENRRKLRSPMTPRAEELAIAKLDRLRAQGHDPQEVLDQSIMQGWKGLFPLGDSENGSKNAGRSRLSAHDKGSLGAAMFLAGSDDESRNGGGIGALGDPVPSSGHGRAEVVSPVRDLLGGPPQPQPGRTAKRLPAVSDST